MDCAGAFAVYRRQYAEGRPCGRRGRGGARGVGFMALFIQGVATSIDALSVGFTIAEYDFFLALLEALIIAMVTFVICLCGLHIGKKVGVKLAGKANILGGVILIFIGLEIFVTGVFL